jgi:hypothetical protein
MMVAIPTDVVLTADYWAFRFFRGLSGARESVHADEGIRCSKPESGGGEVPAFEGNCPECGGSQCPGSL